MRKSIRRKSRKRSVRKSRRKSVRKTRRKSVRKTRRRSVRMRWASPGGSIYPNKNGEGDGADVQIGIIANSYNEYKEEDIQTVLNLIQNGEWSDSYLGAMNRFSDVLNSLVTSITSGNITATREIVENLSTPIIIQELIEHGFWDSRLIRSNEISPYILHYIRAADRVDNIDALKDLIKWQKDRGGLRKLITMARKERLNNLEDVLEEEDD